MARSALLIVLLATSAASCVPRGRHVEVADALTRERAAHRSTSTELRATRAELDDSSRRREGLATQLDQERTRAEALDAAAAEARHQATVAATEREQKTLLVDQLRHELSRVAEHLRAFSEEKSSLAGALDAAEEKASRLAELERESALRSLMVRDLAISLSEPVAKGQVELLVDGGQPVVRIPATLVYGEAGMQPEARAVLAKVAHVAQQHRAARVEIKGRAADASGLDLVRSGLVDGGLENARVRATPPSGPDMPSHVELYFVTSG